MELRLKAKSLMRPGEFICGNNYTGLVRFAPPFRETGLELCWTVAPEIRLIEAAWP